MVDILQELTETIVVAPSLCQQTWYYKSSNRKPPIAELKSLDSHFKSPSCLSSTRVSVGHLIECFAILEIVHPQELQFFT